MQSSIVKNFTLLFSGSVLQKVVGLAALAYYARYFRAEEIAIIPLYSLVANLSLVLFGMGIQAYIMKSVPALINSDIGAARSLIRKILVIALLAGIACGFSFFVLLSIFDLSNVLGNMTMLGLIGFAIGASIECLNTAQRDILAAARYFKKLMLLNTAKAFLWPVLIIYFHMHFGIDGIVLGMASVSLVSLVATHYMLSDIMAGKRADDQYNLGIREIISESWPFYLEGALMVFRRQGDMLIIMLLMGAEALGLYYIAKRLGELIWTFVGLADPVLTPELSIKAARSLRSLKDMVELLIKAVLYLVIPVSIAAVCLVPLYILIVSGGRFEEAILPGIILCLKPITEIVRLTVIGRTVLVCCPPTARLYMTLADTAVLLPIAIAGALMDSLSLVAAAPIFSSFVAGYLGFFFLRLRVDVQFPAGEVIKLFFAMLLALLVGYIVYVMAGIGAWGSVFSAIAALSVYMMLFINIVSLPDFQRVSSRVIPVPASQLATSLLKLRINRS